MDIVALSMNISQMIVYQEIGLSLMKMAMEISKKASLEAFFSVNKEYKSIEVSLSYV